MQRQLIERRDRAADRHDRALQRDPTRSTDAFRGELEQVISELEAVVRDSDASTADAAELSRTLAWIGGAYFDLGRGLEMRYLLRSADYYVRAEKALEHVEAPLARAKLDFNFANTLRGLSQGTDVALLEAAQERYERAHRAFSRLGETAFARQAKEYLDGLRSQLGLSRHAAQTSSVLDELGELERQLERGEIDRDAARARMLELKGRLSPARVDAALEQALSDAKQGHARHPERFGRGADASAELDEAGQKLRDALSEGAVAAPRTPRGVSERDVMNALRERLRAEHSEGRVSTERAKQLGALLEQFGGALSSSDDIESLSKSVAATKTISDQAMDFAADASYGGELKPGTRAEELGALLSVLQRFLLKAAMHRSEPPMIRLRERLTELQQQLCSSESSLPAIERDSWRLASDVHGLARGSHLTMARPEWESRSIRQMPQSVFVSGPSLPNLLRSVASERRWTLLSEPERGVYEIERWNQLLGASVAVFCLPDVEDAEDTAGHSTAALEPRRQRAQICYELGIALTLGLPIVVVLREGAVAPFDVPIETTRLQNASDDAPRLAAAIERAVFAVMWGADKDLYEPPPIHEFVRRRFKVDALSGAQSIAWRVVNDSKDDPFTYRTNLERFLEMMSDEETRLLNPAWAPSMPYPRRCFHVTAFRNWSRRTRKAAERACERHHIEYRHGEDSKEQRIIHAIWSELTGASSVLADLTDLNPNAALELGIAHTLGKTTRVVFNGKPEQLFRSLRHTRVATYGDDDVESCIESQVAELAAAE